MSLEHLIDEEIGYLDAIDKAESKDGTDSPTATDIWLYKLEDAATALVKHWSHRKKPASSVKYDHAFQYGHKFCLKSPEDVQSAPDRVLLEAMGLPDVEHWGWFGFMLRDFAPFNLLAGNWGLPSMLTSWGGTSDAAVEATGAERAMQVALYFRELMRERGCDVLAELRQMVAEHREKHSLSDEDLLKELQARSAIAYYVYTSDPAGIRPEAVGRPGKVSYMDEQDTKLRSEIREAAERRRANWDAPHSRDCQQRQADFDREEGLTR